MRKDTLLNSTVRILNFRRWDFSLFKQLLIRFPKETIIRKKLRRAGWAIQSIVQGILSEELLSEQEFLNAHGS